MFLPHEPLGPLSKGPGMMKSNKTKKKAPAGSAATAAAVEPSFKCDICDCEFNNEIPYKAHMSGKKHQKKVNAPAINSMNSRFSCALCQFVGNSPTHLEAHLQGKSHAKKAGLPPPPPGPAQAPPSAGKKRALRTTQIPPTTQLRPMITPTTRPRTIHRPRTMPPVAEGLPAGDTTRLIVLTFPRSNP